MTYERWMKKWLSVGLVAVIPLFSLEECDRGFSPVPVPAGGGNYSAPARAPAQNPSSTGASQPTIAPSPLAVTWNEPAGVRLKKDALTECQRRADQYVKEGRRVSVLNVIPAVKGWLCVFQEN